MISTALLLLLTLSLSRGSITAVSSINRCVNDGSGEILQPNGTACTKKLVVALTVLANEVIGRVRMYHVY